MLRHDQHGPPLRLAEIGPPRGDGITTRAGALVPKFKPQMSQEPLRPPQIAQRSLPSTLPPDVGLPRAKSAEAGTMAYTGPVRIEGGILVRASANPPESENAHRRAPACSRRAF